MKGPSLAVLLLQRHIFAGQKGVAVEANARIVAAGVAVNIVVKGPDPATLVDDVTDLVCLVGPETADPAALLELAPGRQVDMTFSVKRSDEVVSMLAAAVGKVVAAREFQADTLQGFLNWLGHVHWFRVMLMLMLMLVNSIL